MQWGLSRYNYGTSLLDMQMINNMQVRPDSNYPTQEVYEILSKLSNRTHEPVSRQLISPLVSTKVSSQVSLESEAQNAKCRKGEDRWLCDAQPTTKSGEEGGCPREMKVDAQWRGLRGVNSSPRV